MGWKSLLGRLKQVFYYLHPRLTEAEAAWAAGQLSAGERELFAHLALPDRAHAVRVARRLEALGAPGHVRVAALLHDAGKPLGYGLVWRVVGVLSSPWLDGIPASPEAVGWKRGLQIYRWHDRYGLEAAERAGTGPEALALLRAYQAGDADFPWAAALARADEEG